MKKLLIAFLMISLLNSAQAETTCKDVITSCDKALEAKNRQIQLSDLALRQTVDRLTRVELQYKEERESASAWYKSPFLYLSVGLIGGLLLGGLRTK